MFVHTTFSWSCGDLVQMVWPRVSRRVQVWISIIQRTDLLAAEAPHDLVDVDGTLQFSCSAVLSISVA